MRRRLKDKSPHTAKSGKPGNGYACMVQYGVDGIDDVMWTYGPDDRHMLEELFPLGAVVEIMGSDRLGVVLGNLRYLHRALPVDDRTHPNMLHLHETVDVVPDKTSGKQWFIDVLVGTEKKALDPWVLFVKEQTEKHEEQAWNDADSAGSKN